MMFDKSDVYRTEWLDLVFANRNKAYGAYELRQHNAQTTLKALFMASALMVGGVVASYWYSKFSKPAIIRPVNTHEMPRQTVYQISQPLKPKEAPVPAPDKTAKSVKLKTKKFLDLRVISAHLVTEEVPSTIDLKASVIGSENMNGEPITGAANPIETSADTGIDGADAEGTDVVDYHALEKYPEFPGGETAFARYLSRNLRYPVLAVENDISGKVIVSFVIEPNGVLSNIQILRGIGWGCDEEAIRVLQNAPAWTPGKQNGQSVRVAYTMPINFRLSK